MSRFGARYSAGDVLKQVLEESDSDTEWMDG